MYNVSPWNDLNEMCYITHTWALACMLYVALGMVIIQFGSKPMLLQFFQRFSHVVLHFSCMSPWDFTLLKMGVFHVQMCKNWLNSSIPAKECVTTPLPRHRDPRCLNSTLGRPLSYKLGKRRNIALRHGGDLYQRCVACRTIALLQ